MLPDEIVDIIRQYSKPLFRHFKEYNAMLRARNVSDWPELKVKLSGKDAHLILPVIENYLVAYQFHKVTYQEYDSLPFISKPFDDVTHEDYEAWTIYQEKCDQSIVYLTQCSLELTRVIRDKDRT
jgi:hypothetical protein